MLNQHKQGRHESRHLKAAETPANKKHKRSSKTRIVLCIAAAILLLLVLSAVLVLNSLYSKMNTANTAPEIVQPTLIAEEEASEEESTAEDTISSDEILAIDTELYEHAVANEETEEAPEGVFSVLLLGNDSRSNRTDERTDVMLLVTINHDTKKIILTSFLRDLYVYIPGVGSTRLNAANVYGGPELTIETIEQNFGVTIDAYAAVSFECFENVIDSLGGVDIELRSDELGILNNEGYLGSSSGTYHLDGAHALSYVRIRYLDSDFGRTNRQRTVLSAVWQQAKDASLGELYDLLELVLPEITTDLSRGECLSLAMQVSKIRDYELCTLYIPADGEYSDEIISGMMVLVPDIEANTQIVREAIYGR